VTPADRVVALLTDTNVSPGDEIVLRPIATRARDEKLEAHAKRLTIGRTITRKVMKERVALLSQTLLPRRSLPELNLLFRRGCDRRYVRHWLWIRIAMGRYMQIAWIRLQHLRRTILS